MNGEQHMLDLMTSWGYSPLLPSQLPVFNALPYPVHFLVGVIILLAGYTFFLNTSRLFKYMVGRQTNFALGRL